MKNSYLHFNLRTYREEFSFYSKTNYGDETADFLLYISIFIDINGTLMMGESFILSDIGLCVYFVRMTSKGSSGKIYFLTLYHTYVINTHTL